MLAATLIVIALRDVIPIMFLGGDGPANSATAQLAGTLLLVGATFFVTDAVQGIAAGALRGLNDTRVPMLFAAISFWLIGFASAYLLAFSAGFGAVGIWIGFSLGVATFAVLLVCRFNRLTAGAHALSNLHD
jgi:MATE family multidrug resistance protein